jgi:N-acetylneuraminic acid mutarotase
LRLKAITLLFSRPFQRPPLSAFLLLALVACGGDGPSDPSNPDLLIAVSSGNNQTGTVGVALAQPVTVLVTDLLDRPAAGKVVNFIVLTGGGSTTTTTTTGANGLASATWQLGTVAPSNQTLEARVLTPAGVRKSVTFTASAIAAAPDTIAIVAGGTLSAAAGTPVRVLPSVRVVDQFGNTVPDHTVTFAVTQGGGSVQGGVATTDAQGIATVGGWTLGPAQGPNSLTATAQGFASTVVFQATGTSPVASQLTVLTEPSSALVSGTALPQQPVVQIANSSGDPILQAGVTVTAIVADGAGNGTLNGTTTANTDANGMATFAGLGLEGLVGSYSIEFTAAGLAPDTSITVALSAGPPTTMTVNAGDNQSENAGTVLPVAPSVLITDNWSNGIGGIEVTFAIASGNGAIVGGTQTTAPDGVASVGSWQLGPTSGPNSLTATAQPAGLANNPISFSATALGDFWSPRQNMRIPRRFTAFAYEQNQLYTAGGRDGSLSVLDTVEVYNPVVDGWSGRRSMNTERVGASAGFIQGLFYVAGGNPQGGQPVTSVEVYNPANNSWSFVASLPTERNFSAFTVLNDKLYLAGGGNSSGQIKSTVVYDPATNQWTQLADLPANRNDAVAVALNGLIYIIGGQVNNTIDGALLVYDPQANSYTPLASMPTPRFHANAEVLNGKIYVISGLTFGSNPTPVVEIYDPVTNTWDTTAAPIPTARSAAAIMVFNGVIYVVGGSANNTVTGAVEAYVP